MYRVIPAACRGGEWSYLRGGLTTLDHDYGIINKIHHNIGTHVAHHLVSGRVTCVGHHFLSYIQRVTSLQVVHRLVSSHATFARKPLLLPSCCVAVVLLLQFPQIPHYNLQEATEAIKPILGPYYRWALGLFVRFSVLEWVSGLQGIRKALGR